MGIRILTVEDDEILCRSIIQGLEQRGYQCDSANDGLLAADMLEMQPAAWDLVLLDVMLPGADGFQLMEYLAPFNMPVIFITAKSAVLDRVEGLRLGADDYIVKPFEMIELIARIEAVMRRHGKGSTQIFYEDIMLDTAARQVTKAGQIVHLKTLEFELLRFLLQNQGVALFRETIYERVWQREFTGETRTVDLHILRLRQKLSWTNQLETLPKIGYRLRKADKKK